MILSMLRKGLPIAAALLGAAASPAYANDPLKIGLAIAETPPGNVIQGSEIMAGARIAAELINQDGGVAGQQIELVFEDSSGVPERGIAAVEKLILEDGVAALTGIHHSNVALAEIEVAHREGIPYVNTNAWSGAVREAGYPEVFSPSNYSARSAKAMADTLVALGAKRVVAFTENTDYGIGQMEDLKALLVEGTDIEFEGTVLDRQANDYLPAIIPLKDNPPDVIVNIMVQPGAYRLINQLHELGVAPTASTLLYDGAGVGDAPDFWDNVGDAGIGMVSFGLYHPAVALSPWGERVKAAFAEASDHAPSRLIFQAADCVALIADAAARADSIAPADITKALATADFAGSTGEIKFASQPGALFQQWVDVPYVTYQFTAKRQATADSVLLGDQIGIDTSKMMVVGQ